MSRLTDQQIEQVARRVVDVLRSRTAAAPSAPAPVSPSTGTLPAGAFATIDEAVAAAKVAHLQLMTQPLAKRQEMIAAIRSSMLQHAEELARRACEETGLGRVEDKIIKNRLVTTKTPGTEVLVPITWTGDRGLTLNERAPFGVIAAITPTTNPTSTIICNTIGMVAAGNAVVFNVHPNAKKVSVYNIALINEAIQSVGGPANLVTCIPEPTIASAQELMKHADVRLVVVTGGPGVVQAALTSGKRAICAGPGNPPVVVDETADIDKAARDVVFGASFDNNVICTDEKEVFVVDSVADAFVKAMTRHDAVLLAPSQQRKIESVIFAERKGPRKPAVVNKDMIGRNADFILKQIGMIVPPSTRLAVMEVPQDHPLVWTEQLMPVLPVVRVRSADEGIDLAKEAEHGFGHSAAMHSKHLDHLSRMARVMNCSIFVKNAPIAAGLGYEGEGYSSFSIASPTGEGLTDARSFSRERRCVLVDHFRIV